jgi:hypothetical protein
VLRDGSIMVNFDDGDIMARLDACSNALWTRHGIFHHSMQRADDGSYWTWRAEGSPVGQHQYLVNFDPDTGDTLREIDMIGLIRGMGAQAVIFAARPDEKFKHVDRTPENRGTVDRFHPNDIDVLTADLAPAFPGFSAGDLMISLRSLHLVAVLDPDELEFRWWSHGPWRFQHDPDFTADGKISVFDNNMGGARAEIIKMDPVTREVTNELFNGEVRFYTHSMGKHQYLPNGNLLIVVPGEGRVLEVDAHGDKVMEFNNISGKSPENNVHVEHGYWLPADYFDTPPACQ